MARFFRSGPVPGVTRVGKNQGMARQLRHIDIARLRLGAQNIVGETRHDPVQAVAAMTAMQAQDLPGTLWAIGLRATGATEADVRAAFNNGRLVRSWPMRGTLHALTPDDLRLILPLSRERLVASFGARHRELGIAQSDVAIAAEAAESALSTGTGALLRTELFAVFEAAGQPTSGQRGAHLAFLLAHAGLVCLGPFVGTEQAFVLLDNWAPATAHQPDRDEALAILALRYFRSHGPATVADFAWWARLTLTDARTAAAAVAVSDRLSVLPVDDVDYLTAPEFVDLAPRAVSRRSVVTLPGFDEFLLGYTDRSAALEARHSALIVRGNNGVFKPTVVVGGRVVGTWTRRDKPRSVDITVQLFRDLTTTEARGMERAFERYGTFRDKAVALNVSTLDSGEVIDPARAPVA